jgi:hypothetical protein
MRKACTALLDLMELPPESIGVIVVPLTLGSEHWEDGAGETDEVAAEPVGVAVLLLPLDPEVMHAVG